MKRTSPAAGRNSAPIADVLAQELPASGTVLEIASGTGEHAVFMARRFPKIDWQPTDPDLEAIASFTSWAKDTGLTNLKPPMKLDARSPEWPLTRADAVVCINMVHISPWEATEGLFTGAMRLLHPEAPLVLYGPYFEDDVETAASNLAFDQSLKARDSEWGIRDISAIDELGVRRGFIRTGRYEMPANNLILVYRLT